MTYAREVCLDADSHLMELPDFLTRHAPAALHDQLPSLDDVGLAIESIRMDELRDATGLPPAVVQERLALGDALLKGPKWHDALGSFNTVERGQALDLLGFERQVVFSSFCSTRIFGASDDIKYPAAAAHNRSMAAFCNGDPRLIGVALIPLDDVELALAEMHASLELGLGAFWLPSHAPGGRSPGHPDLDPVWSLMRDANKPFLLHVGSSPLSIAPEWMNDGRPAAASARGRAEVIGSKDLSVIYQSAERFISVLVLDGVLERFPTLKGAVIELGAGWVPSMIRRLDHAADIWSRSEPHLAAMQRRPSEQIEAQLRFTPYPFEDVGQLISESNNHLYLFSSDYPHAEGGRDPLGRFNRTLTDASAASRRRFFADNFRTLYG